MNRIDPTNGWVLFDGTCGICTKFIGSKPHFLIRHGFGVAAQQDDWVKLELEKRNHPIAKEICLLLPSGQILSGVDTYREIIRHSTWLKPLYFLSGTGSGYFLAKLLYRTISNNRYRISRLFHLSGKFE